MNHVELFAGIGGFRMAFFFLGGQCVFSSEWDEQAKKTGEVQVSIVNSNDLRTSFISTKKVITNMYCI